jgi:hypothetical protein
LGSGHIGGQNQPTVEAARKKNRNREYLYRGIATRAILTVAGCAACAFWTGLRLRSYGCSIHTTEARLVVAQGWVAGKPDLMQLEKAPELIIPCRTWAGDSSKIIIGPLARP